MLIARQKPDATNVAGLRTWNSLGRFVKRGEKGIFILAPMVGRRSTKDVATEEPSEDATTEGQRTLYGFRAVYVFDRLSRDLRPSLCALDRSPVDVLLDSGQAHHRSTLLPCATLQFGRAFRWSGSLEASEPATTRPQSQPTWTSTSISRRIRRFGDAIQDSFRRCLMLYSAQNSIQSVAAPCVRVSIRCPYGLGTLRGTTVRVL